MRVLLLAPVFPYPPNYGGAVRTWNLLVNVAERHEVDLLALTKVGVPSEHLDEVRKVCRHAEVVWYQPEQDPPLVDTRPRTVKEHSSDGFRQRVRELMSARRYDLVHLECAQMGAYLAEARACPVLLDAHDLLSRLLLRGARMAKWSGGKVSGWWEYLKMVAWESRVWATVDCVVTVCEQEKRIVEAFAPRASVVCLENGVDLERFLFTSEGRDRNVILFVGYMRYPPNVDALVHFYRCVFPLILGQRPETRLHVVGAGMETDLPLRAPEAEAEMRADPQVRLVGTVEDIHPHLASAAALVVPLRVGAGTRVRILEAFAAGLPVVSTSLGAEGLPVQEGRELRLADEPATFAKAVVEVLDDPAKAAAMAGRARQLVERHYDWRALAQRLNGVYQTLGSGGKPT